MTKMAGRAVLLALTMTIVSPPGMAESRGIVLESKEAAGADALALGTFRALLIGNNTYRDPSHRWQPLQTALAGAKAMQRLLAERYAFSDVTLGENGDRRAMLEALAELSRKVQAGDNVLVYYAGHGYLEEEGGRGYWVPVDADGRDTSTFIRNSTIRDELNIIAEKARHTLLIADSCFSGSLLRSGVRAITPDSGVERYYQKVAAKKSVQIVTAGGVEFVDDSYQNSGQSPFTYFLLNELQHNDKPLITVSELSTNVEKAVANNSEQVPESGVLQGAGDELGEFIFVKIDVRVSGVSRENVKVKVNVIDDEGARGSPPHAAAPAPAHAAAPAAPVTAPTPAPAPPAVMMPVPSL